MTASNPNVSVSPVSSRVLTAGELRRVVFASSLGTVFEWYDFYLYGSLATIISRQFFSGVNQTAAFIFALLAFAAGFAVRPFGALVFGRLGDIVGRKHTFLVTIVIMGASTSLVGVLPSYAQIGVIAPITPDPAASPAGACARRRIRRRGDVCRRACAARQARPLHGLDPDDGDAGTAHVAPRDPWVPYGIGDRFLRGVGMAHSVPALHRAARHLGLDSAEAERIAAVPGDEESGRDVEGAAHGVVRTMEQPAIGAARPFRTDGRAGRRLVHRTVLHAVLPDADPQGGCADGEHSCRRFAGTRHPVLPGFWPALRHDWPQADHHGRVSARRADVFSDLQGARPCRKPGARRRSDVGAGCRSGGR